MTDTATTLPPDCTISLTGEEFGGAYWNSAEFELTLRAVDSNTWRVILESASGAIITRMDLDRDQALLIIRMPATSSLGWARRVPGLVRTTEWNVSGDADDVAVTVRDFGEIITWLEFFLSQSWPADETEWDG